MTDAEPDNPLARLTVLVIEDEPFTRTVVARVVAGLGCAAVLESGDAVSGLETLRSRPVDVVLCDLDMKPLNGLDLLRGLRTSDSEAERRLPLIFVTGRATTQVVEHLREGGAREVLGKPFSPLHLIHLIHRFTGDPNTPDVPGS